MSLGVLGLLLLASLALRLPFFFRAVINIDEGPFLLVGQSLLEGHLPYVERFALKPPLAFALYAVAGAVSGRSLIGVRLVGALFVVATAFLLYLIVARLWDRRAGLVAALLCVVTISLIPTGQATLTEHLALPWLIGALWLLIGRPPSVPACFLAGVLMAVAALVRLNLAFAAVVIGACLLALTIRRAPLTAVRQGAAFALGGALVVALTWVPYALTGQSRVWWSAVVVAPLGYSELRSTLFLHLRTYVRDALMVYGYDTGLPRVRFPAVAFVWLGAVAGWTVVLARWRAPGLDRRGVLLFAAATAGVGLGILKSGAPHPHHMIELVPFAAALAGVFLCWLVGRRRWLVAAIVGLLVLASIELIIAEYQLVTTRARTQRPLRHGQAFDIAEYLGRENPDRRPVYLLGDEVAYWLAGLAPPTRLTTHPATILEPSVLVAMDGPGASAMSEIRKVFDRRPAFVVVGPRPALPDDTRQWLQQTLESDYTVEGNVRGRVVYRRRADR